jgi:hypothetical protein
VARKLAGSELARRSRRFATGGFRANQQPIVDSAKNDRSGQHHRLKVISLIVPLRMDEATLKVGDDAVHGETAYAIGTEGE